MQQRNEGAALQAIALMQQGSIVELDTVTAIHAAKLGVRLRLPLADSVILATARLYEATLWTQDSDFDGVPGVEVQTKSKIVLSDRRSSVAPQLLGTELASAFEKR